MKKQEYRHSVLCIKFSVNQNHDKKHSQPLWYFTHSTMKIIYNQRCEMDESTQILKNLGKRIANLRKQKGMNQEEFADVSGKMINTISNIERGLSDPKVTTLLSLAEALNVSVDMLFNNHEQQPFEKLPENVQTIIKLIKNEDTRTLKVIQKQIEALLELKSI